MNFTADQVFVWGRWRYDVVALAGVTVQSVLIPTISMDNDFNRLQSNRRN